jgi:predicted enzyme related to lactoylglutathione lyase
MNNGIQIIIYPVKDAAKAKAQFQELLGVEPYADTPYYIGFKVGNQDIGLDPHGHQAGVTAYYQVSDIQASFQKLLDAGAETVEPVKDVGGGRQVGSVKDANGNLVGLFQDPVK